jgi:hypothetical protein
VATSVRVANKPGLLCRIRQGIQMGEVNVVCVAMSTPAGQQKMDEYNPLYVFHLDSRNCFLASGNVKPSFTISSCTFFQ